jgi:predicted transcriptional regulator
MILNIQGLDSFPRTALSPVETLPPEDLTIASARKGLAPTFHGSKPPVTEIQKEKAVHRLAAHMIASGARPKTVAAELDVAESTVSNWIRQPWFQANVNQIIQDEFSGDITQMLKSAASSAVLVTMDLMNNSVDEKVKLSAAKDILDRFRGKPTNFVHHTNHQISENPAEEIKRLEETLLKTTIQN